MRDALEPTPDPGWILGHEGYNVLTESAVESRFALGNGFLGMRAARSVSRGPTWLSWLGYIRWASWPRCYVAGLFDIPNTEPPVPALVPVADWSRVRVLLDGEPLLAREGEVLAGTRRLDLRRGVLLSSWTHRNPAGITVTGRELRLLSRADCAAGLQLMQFALDRDGVEVTLEASFAIAGLGMEPTQLDEDLGAWRTEGTGKGVAMAGAASLLLADAPLAPDRPFPLRWAWHWRSAAGQVAELDRLVAVARADTRADDPVPPALEALGRSRALGWRAVLAAHEAAWEDRWTAGEVRLEGDDDLQRALRFAVYHLSSAANPGDERVSIGARGLTGDAYFGHVFWDTETYLLPFYTAIWPEAARALLMYRFHTLPGARAKAARIGCKGALYAWESADTGEETTPERVVAPDGVLVDILTGRMEHHVSADIAYAVWQYWRATGDDTFLLGAGAEILLETARFWASRAVPEADGRRHIRHVDRAGRVPRGRGRQRLHQRDGALEHRPRAGDAGPAAHALARPCGSTAGEAGARRGGNRGLARCDRAHRHRPRFGDRPVRAVRRLPRPGTARPRRLPRYHRPDRRGDRPRAHAARAGGEAGRCRGTARAAARGVPRRHGRDELPPLRAALRPRQLAERRLPRAGRGTPGRFRTGAAPPARGRGARPRPGPDSAGGVRMAGLGGVWQAVVLGFAGLDLMGDILGSARELPPEWRSLSFRVHWRGRVVQVAIAGGVLQATLAAGEAMELRVAGNAHQLAPGATREVPL